MKAVVKEEIDQMVLSLTGTLNASSVTESIVEIFSYLGSKTNNALIMDH